MPVLQTPAASSMAQVRHCRASSHHMLTVHTNTELIQTGRMSGHELWSGLGLAQACQGI